MDKARGITVVTSDDGDIVGGQSCPVPIRAWGHTSGTYTDQLVIITWLVYEQGECREIVAGPSKGVENVDFGRVNERLNHLGCLYKQLP